MAYNISAVILAGGESKRFGGMPKTEIIVGSRKIIFRMHDVIREVFDEIIIVTNSPERYADIEKCKIAGDIYIKSGPLGGIHSAMKASEKEAIFVFAGDMPFLDKGLIITLIDKFNAGGASALVPILKGLSEPLHAIYMNSLAGEIEKLIRDYANPSVKDLLNEIAPEYISLRASFKNLKAFTNINTSSDLNKAELLAG